MNFYESPDYKFALEQGLGATARSNSAQRGSGNALAALMQYGSGLASQNYNTFADRNLREKGQTQQYELGKVANAAAIMRNQNDLLLGNRNADTAQQRNLFDYNIGNQQAANTRQRNEYDYSMGRARNATDQYQAETGRYTAETGRGNALADAYFRNRGQSLDFYRGL
jgi:hypothetical protein